MRDLQQQLDEAEALLAKGGQKGDPRREQARKAFAQVLALAADAPPAATVETQRLRALLGLVVLDLLSPEHGTDPNRAEELALQSSDCGDDHPDNSILAQLKQRARWVAALALIEFHPEGSSTNDIATGPAPAEMALDALRAALDSPYRPHDLELHLRALETLRLAARRSFDDETAGLCLEKSLEITREAQADAAAMDHALALAKLDYQRGDSDRAEAFLTLALAHAGAQGPRVEAATLIQAAALRRRWGHLRGAEVALQSALELFEQLGVPDAFLHTSLALGDVRTRLAEFSTAFEVLDQGRAMAVLLDHPIEELVLIRRLLHLAEQRQDEIAAQRLASEAHRKAEQLPPSHELERAYTHWVLAMHSRRRGADSTYYADLGRALDYAEMAGDYPMAYLAASQLGEPHPVELVKRLQQPPADGRDLLARAAAVREFPGDLDLRRGFLEAARTLLEQEPGTRGEAHRELLDRIDEELHELALCAAGGDLEKSGSGSAPSKGRGFLNDSRGD